MEWLVALARFHRVSKNFFRVAIPFGAPNSPHCQTYMPYYDEFICRLQLVEAAFPSKLSRFWDRMPILDELTGNAYSKVVGHLPSLRAIFGWSDSWSITQHDSVQKRFPSFYQIQPCYYDTQIWIVNYNRLPTVMLPYSKTRCRNSHSGSNNSTLY